MLNLKTIVSVGLLCCISICASAQDAEKDKKKNARKKQTDKKQVDRVANRLLASFKKAELTEEQTKQAKAIIAKHASKIEEAQKSVNALFSREQQKKRAAAMKQGKKDGLSGKELSAKVDEVTGQTDEIKKKLNEARKVAQKAMGAAKADIAKLLTEEQTEAMGKKRGQGKKKDGDKKKKDGDK